MSLLRPGVVKQHKKLKTQTYNHVLINIPPRLVKIIPLLALELPYDCYMFEFSKTESIYCTIYSGYEETPGKEARFSVCHVMDVVGCASSSSSSSSSGYKAY